MSTSSMVQFLALVIFLSTSVIANPYDQRITNGAQAASGQFPYIVSVTVGGAHICGGFIYNANWIVTTASCVYQYVPSQLSVTVGQLSLINPDQGEVSYPIYGLNVFDGYDYTSGLHDIALLETSIPMIFGSTVNLIGYDIAQESTADTGIVAGWGATYEGGVETARLRYITVHFGSSCLDYGKDQFYPKYMVCAGDSNVDAGSPCHLDEGSPLVQDFGGVSKVVGIMSKNAGCASGFKPSIYTRVQEYQPWLEKLAGYQPIVS